MDSWLDQTSKKTLYLIKTPTGKIKVAGMYKLTPLGGGTLTATLTKDIRSVCGLEFDDIEWLDTYHTYRDRSAGQAELTFIEYKA